MASTDVFKIEILNWEKHNGQRPKGKLAYTHFLVANRIFDDHKVATLTSLERLLYVIMLARCADERAAIISPTRGQLMTSLGQTRYDIVTALMSLERNQLVKVLEQPALIREKKRKEEKRREKKLRKDSENQKPETGASPAPAKAVANADADPKPAGIFIAGYCDRWKARHGSSPPITGKDAGIAKRVVDGMSPERIAKYLDAYFAMPDAFVIKAKHPIEFFEMKLKEIAAFAESGAFVTRKQAAQADDMASNMLLLEQVRKGQL